MNRVLDLFSAAAGGWSLGMHRAGFKTVAACEAVAWRRALYAENNPGVRLYDDVRTLTADRLGGDLGFLPDVIVGSPPCQDISSANSKGKGVDGERSGLFFEATRIVRECRPRWVALENSSRLRTKGADRVLAELEGDGYTPWPIVVRARDVGANHERPRAWILAFDAEQLTDPDGDFLRQQSGRSRRPGGGASTLTAHHAAPDANGDGWAARRCGRGIGLDLSFPHDLEHAESFGCPAGRTWRRGPDGHGATPAACGAAADACGPGQPLWEGQRRDLGAPAGAAAERDARAGDGAHAYQDRQPDGAQHDEVGRGEGAGGDAAGPWAEWNGGLAGHLRLDDGLSAWVAQSRVAVGGPRGTAAASLLVEAFGDAVVPQIPEAIGRAILRTEAALAALYGAAA